MKEIKTGTGHSNTKELLYLNILEHEHIVEVVQYMQCSSIKENYFIVMKFVELVNAFSLFLYS